MRLTPHEMANSTDLDSIEDWIGEATTEELREFLQKDISHNIRNRAVGKIISIAYQEGVKSHNLIWWIYRPVLAIMVLVIAGSLLHWIFSH